MISKFCSYSYSRWSLTNMFIAVVMQLRGLACGVILTTQMSSMVLALDGFASALLLSKPGAPITFSSTNRYLSILPASKCHWRCELSGGLQLLNRTLPNRPLKSSARVKVVGGKWFFIPTSGWRRILDRFRTSPFRCVAKTRAFDWGTTQNNKRAWCGVASKSHFSSGRKPSAVTIYSVDDNNPNQSWREREVQWCRWWTLFVVQPIAWFNNAIKEEEEEPMQGQ